VRPTNGFRVFDPELKRSTTAQGEDPTHTLSPVSDEREPLLTTRLFDRNHAASVTADALDALGRTEDAKALRGRYGVASSDDLKRP
jgi:hypothetical protein